MSDERKGLPSASSVHRYAACPGSFLLERDIPEEAPSSDATLGTRVHAVLGNEAVTPPLNDEEQRLVEWCQEQEAELVIKAFGGVLIEPLRETRMWASDAWLNEAWSGKPDAVYLYHGRALVIDYKTGRNRVSSAEENLQLRALAVLVHEVLGASDITVAIIQPLAGKPTLCWYGPSDVAQAVIEIKDLMARIITAGQPRIPTADGCKYCKAKAVCPEAREAALAPPLRNQPLDLTPYAIAATLTDKTLSEFLLRAPQAEAVIDACRAEARRRLEQGETIPGWKLKPGATRETITQPNKVFDRFISIGGTVDLFMPSITVSKTKLKDAIKATTGSKGKALEAEMDALLFECVESKQGAATLVQEASK